MLKTSLTLLLLLLSAAPVLAEETAVVRDWMLQDDRVDAPDDDYIQSCQKRRDERLKNLKAAFPKIVFTKHFDLGGSHYAYTEAQSDAQAERNFVPRTALCLLELNQNGEYSERTLIDDPNGVIRDPAVSYDGKKIVFAWKKSNLLDDYHLYEYDTVTGNIRQLTFGLGYADYEPCILPNGDLVFNSTRCVQIVDCWWTEVSNLYRCDKDGRFLRRLSFDQVHTNFPSVLDDGRIIYTRWDYNDRGQIFPQGLFQMNPDGTSQTEYYGNNSWFPTTLLHARGIPNSGGKVAAVFSGHHNRQYGKLGIIDVTKGRQENSGTQLIAPIRETTADRIDAWGQSGDRFAFPYPINEHEFLVGYNSDQNAKHTTTTPFGIYWIDENGQRELLAYDETISCHQPVPLAARDVPYERTSMINHDLNYGTYTIQDVYTGPGLQGIERGKAKMLRVIALGFRTVGIGSNGNSGPAGGAMSSTPVSIGNGSWDVKIPLGDTPIYEDGSASFLVPSKTPLYFQILDENGHAIQTMRSWSTLQPGEVFSCIGCHEDKNTIISAPKQTIAMQKGAQPLKPFYNNVNGKPQGFSFAKEVQPILDKHCIECHQNPQKQPPYRTVALMPPSKKPILGRAFFRNLEGWRYTMEQPKENWMSPEYFSQIENLPAVKVSGGIGDMYRTKWNTPDVWIWGVVELPDDWKPQPLILNCFHDEDTEIYVNGQKLYEVEGFNVKYEETILSKNDAALFKPGKNYLAAHTHQTTGSQGIDFGIYMFQKESINSVAPELEEKPFSLKNDLLEDWQAKRSWSLSYLNLTNSSANNAGVFTGKQTPIVNWINIQESPAMLPPYKAGAAKSKLMKMLDPKLAENGKTHSDVQLTREELDKIAAWIDLLVPACGDYAEGNLWNDAELKKYDYYEAKRRDMQKLDDANNLRFVSYLQNKTPPQEELNSLQESSNTYRNLAFNPNAKDRKPNDNLVKNENLTKNENSAKNKNPAKSAANDDRKQVDKKQDETPNDFPAASSNSVYKDLKEFAASNCLDGKTDNKGHGVAFPSWGPNNVEETSLWWQVDFGKPIKTDQVAIVIRADFPHDTWWKECTIECSNGFTKKIDLQKTFDKQIFTFPAQNNVTWLRLTNFVPAQEGVWAALTEVEVWGIEGKAQSAK